jgi:hypothetical protein
MQSGVLVAIVAREVYVPAAIRATILPGGSIVT